jgi:hypothetical protein
MNLNIFVLHTPFQLYTAQLVVEQNFGNQNAHNILLYEGVAAAEVVHADLWDEIHIVSYAQGVGGFARQVVESNFLLVNGLVEEAQGAVRIFISDIAWPLNNRIFFSKSVLNRVAFHMVSDGIATYTCPELSLVQQLKNAGKFVLGHLGVTARYSAYGASMLGIDHPRVSGLYSFRAELLRDLYSCNVTEIRLDPIAGERDLSCGLFLDQPYRGFMSSGAWKSIRTETRHFLSQSGFSRLYYKAHPMCDATYREDLQDLNMEVIESKLPAELMFRSLNAGTVISYTSGALFNLKSLAGDRVRAIAYRPEVFLAVDGSGGRSRRSLIDVFRDSGVEVLTK